jgi:Resolvase, N terminal domain
MCCTVRAVEAGGGSWPSRAAQNPHPPLARLGPGAPSAGQLRAALYARVSTTEQTPENQLVALRTFAAARGWEAKEFVDHGVSGAKDRRPALDALLGAVRARHVDRVVCACVSTVWRALRATW